MRDESRLIQEALAGSHRAFRGLYDRHAAQLYRFMRQFSSDADEVEEWVQRTFIKAFRHLGSFEGRSRFSSWLLRLAINEMRMDRRRAQRFEPAGDSEYETAGGEQSSEFEWSETMKSLLLGLSDEKKAVFLLHAVEGYSHGEIAAMLGIAESSSRSILARTKKFLQQEWNRQVLE